MNGTNIIKKRMALKEVIMKSKKTVIRVYIILLYLNLKKANNCICIFSLFLIYSCNNSSLKNEKIEKDDKGGKIVSQYKIMNHDTLLDGYVKSYFPSGRLKKSIKYVNGLKNGVQVEYDSLGNIKSTVLFINGDKNGYGYNYNNGEIEKNYYVDDRKVFNQRMNSKSKPIQIRVFNYADIVQYVILFDSLGNKIYENGFVIEDSIFYVQPDKNGIHINKPVEIKLFTTHIPNYSRSIQLDYFNHDRRKVSIQSNIINNDFFTLIKFTPIDTGNQVLVFIGKLTDESGKIVGKDTVSRIINVKR
jgi:hypothetical protein